MLMNSSFMAKCSAWFFSSTAAGCWRRRKWSGWSAELQAEYHWAMPFLSKEIMKLFNSCGGMMEVKKPAMATGVNVKCVFYRGASVIYSLEHSHWKKKWWIPLCFKLLARLSVQQLLLSQILYRVSVPCQFQQAVTDISVPCKEKSMKQ